MAAVQPLKILVSSIFTIALFSVSVFGQLQFGGSSSNGGSNDRNPSIVDSSVNANDTDNRFFFDGPGRLPSTGNEALDGGIIGLGVGAGLGAVGAAVLGPVVQGALSQNSCGRGRKKRQTSFPGSSSGAGSSSQSPEFGQPGGGGGDQGGDQDQELDGDERFFLPSGGSCTCSGRRKRQAPSEADINNRFFGLGHLLNLGGNIPHCGSCCYGNNQGFNNNNGGFNNNNGGFNNNNGGFHNNNNNGGFHNNNNGGFSQSHQGYNRCQCEYGLTFRDRYGNVHGACKRRDSSGRTWCYTTGWNNRACQDLKPSKKFPSNPWSYSACGSSRSGSG